MLTGVSIHNSQRGNMGLTRYQRHIPKKEYSGHTPVDAALTEKCKTQADAAWKGLIKKLKGMATNEERLEFSKNCQKKYKEFSKKQGIEFKDAWANGFASPIEGLVMDFTRAISKKR